MRSLAVALASRAFFQIRHPTKLIEKQEKFINAREWCMIFPLRYMPSFQPMELFWQLGKQCASFNFKRKRSMAEVCEYIRRG